jgi:hypothetical protein
MKNLIIIIGFNVLLLISFSCQKESTNPVNHFNNKPQVSLVKPISNILLLDEVNIEIEASDDIGITKVEFFACNKLAKTFTSAPYKFIWFVSDNINTQDSLTHWLYVKAYDADSNCTTTSFKTYIYTKYCYGIQLKNDGSSNSFTLNWLSHGNTDQIVIQKAKLSDPLNYVDIGTLPSNSLAFTVINPDTVASYQYRVKSFISGDVSYSNPVLISYSNGTWHQN